MITHNGSGQGFGGTTLVRKILLAQYECACGHCWSELPTFVVCGKCGSNKDITWHNWKVFQEIMYSTGQRK